MIKDLKHHIFSPRTLLLREDLHSILFTSMVHWTFLYSVSKSIQAISVEYFNSSISFIAKETLQTHLFLN